MTEFTQYTHYALTLDGWSLTNADGDALELSAHDVSQLERRGCLPATQSPDIGRLLHPASYVHNFPGSPRFWRAHLETDGATWLEVDSSETFIAQDGHRYSDVSAHQRAWDDQS
jgi:hypothetical protein